MITNLGNFSDTVPLELQEAIESIDENSDAEANVIILANTNIKKQWVVKHLRARIRRERESATDNIDLELDVSLVNAIVAVIICSNIVL